MNASLRGFAGFAGAVVVAASLTWCAPALADPTPPTLESLEPPAPPPPPPQAAPPQAPAGSSSSTASDEAAIRQTVQASTDAYNGENWDAFMGLMCAAKQATFPLEMIKNQRAERGPLQVTVTAVTVTGDTATATTVMSDRFTVTAPYHLVREGSWKICG